ncbi:MAG: DNA polymerase III subunit gamma/tau [Firmicutes bacterium]|nr:DNA polymerase III subunit gamma/tau [Bacillota bacterium]
MHQTLYRKYRPSVFGDVVGQEHITSVLSYEVENAKTTHAYLFCGSRGTGKTSCAKILAKALNCEAPVGGSPCGKCGACRMIESGAATDVVEMDAASNNGVDYIRDIKDEVAYPPSSLKNRVYIIDEVHMLSQGAFNALLKTLEEPPPHVVFILATTELQKIPATILSRCQRFDFRRIPAQVITERLKYISGKEGIDADEESLRFMARLARGGMRDAISLLELCSGSGGHISATVVREKVGVGGCELAGRLFCAAAEADYEKIFFTISEIYESSIDIAAFWRELISYCRDLIVIKTVSEPDGFIDATPEELETMKTSAKLFSKDKLLWYAKVFDDAYTGMQRSPDARRVIAEMALVRLCDERTAASCDALAARLAKVEEALENGSFVHKAHEKEKSLSASLNESPGEGEATSDDGFTEKPAETIPGAEKMMRASIASAPFEYAPELCEKLSEIDEAAASMLRLAGLFAENGRLVIRVNDAFSSMLLGAEETKKETAAIVSSFAGCAGFAAEDIIVEISEKIETDDPLTEL